MHTITAKMLDPAGGPLQGKVTFSLEHAPVIGDDGAVYGGSVTFPVDRGGSVRARLREGEYTVTFNLWEPASGRVVALPPTQISVTGNDTLPNLMRRAETPAAGVAAVRAHGELVVDEDTHNLLIGDS